MTSPLAKEATKVTFPNLAVIPEGLKQQLRFGNPKFLNSHPPTLDLKTSGIYFQSHFNEEYIHLLTFLPNRLLMGYQLEQTVFKVPLYCFLEHVWDHSSICQWCPPGLVITVAYSATRHQPVYTYWSTGWDMNPRLWGLEPQARPLGQWTLFSIFSHGTN